MRAPSPTPADLLRGPSPDELVAIARHHGAELAGAYGLPGGRHAFLLMFRSHAGKVNYLDELAWLDAYNPALRRLAEQIVAGARSRKEQVWRLHAFVRDNVVHTPEPIETFSPPLWVLATRVGDCDDTARALCALLRALGFEASIDTLGRPPKHVAALVWLEERWCWLETTVKAYPGEHPLAAARRLGMRERSDLR